MTDPSANLGSARPCPTCGYDLRGQSAEVQTGRPRCPECGELEPPPRVTDVRRPGVIGHIVVAASFATPLVITAFEASRQMVEREIPWVATWAPEWLLPVILAGAAGIVGCMIPTRVSYPNRTAFLMRGAAYLAAYIALLGILSFWIEWHRYMV